MSRISSGRTGMMSRENLAQQQQQHPFQENKVSTSHGQPQRRSALGDISAMVSNVSATATGSLAKGFTSATSAREKTNATSKSVFTSTGNGSSAPVHLPAQTMPMTGPAAMDTDEDYGEEGMIMDVDKADVENPQCVVEYVADIFRYLRQEETQSHRLPQPEYINNQEDINEKMRGILVDWLVEVHLKYKLKPETLYLAINLIDRFLEKRQVSRKRLQLIGVSGMLIAAKYEEIYPPEIRDFVYITDKAYTRDEVLAMEISMLNALEFEITLPSPVAFLDRFAKVNKCDETHMNLARYVMELTLCDIKMLRYCPSHLAAAALFLSNKLLRRHPAWPAQLIKHTRYTEHLIKSCAKEMCCLVEGADRSSLAAVRKKYAHKNFNAVSTMVSSV